jgi:hypothetical protein
MATLEVVKELDRAPGNVAVTPDARIFISYHPLYFDNEMSKAGWRVVELVKGQREPKPFPNREWARPRGASGEGMNKVLGIRADERWVVWMLDFDCDNDAVPRVVAWDTLKNGLHMRLDIPHPAGKPSLLNDLAVDLKNDALYLADIGSDDGSAPAIVVVNLRTGASRRVLEHTHFVNSDSTALEIEGWPVRSAALDPITIDTAFTWVYFGAMHGKTIWRVPSANLTNADLPAAELAGSVEKYCDKRPATAFRSTRVTTSTSRTWRTRRSA